MNRTIIKKIHFMKQIIMLLSALLLTCCSQESDAQAEITRQTDVGSTLIVYYSYTGNCREIASSLSSLIEADVAEVLTVAENQDYNANGYKLGNDLLNAINSNPENLGSYPAIKAIDKDVSNYDNIIFITPLWHAQMAAPAQTYLFQNREKLAGKRLALIVSSWSSGISTVVSNARRLVPNATWAGEALWINHNNHSSRASLIENWLQTQNFQNSTDMTQKMYVTIDGQTETVSLTDNGATQSLVAKLQESPLALTLNSSGGFEIWGALGFSLPRSDEQMNAQPGDVVLYNGSNICLFYGTNSWSYTRLGKIENLSGSELNAFLKAGQTGIDVTLSLTKPTGIAKTATSGRYTKAYTLHGTLAQTEQKGIVIQNGKKIIK